MRGLTAAVAAVGLLGTCGAEPIPYDGPEWPKVTPAFEAEAERIQASTPVRRADAPDFSHPPDVCVRREGGTPRLFLDGKPFPLFCGRLNTAQRKDHLPRLADLPFNVVTVDNIYWPALFPKTGTVDTNVLMKRAALFATNCPNAYFIWTVEATVPREWAKAHPDEICRDSAGEMLHDGLMPNWSCGSHLALDIAKDQVRKVIDAIEASPYANRTIGYLITSGHTTEWLGWQAKEWEGRTIDFSPAALKSFRAFAGKRYGAALANVDMPDFKSRHAVRGHLLWNPRDHLAAVACHEWLSEQMSANLADVCGDAKRHLGGKKLVGSYYGYTMTLFIDGNSQTRAHYALERVLASGAVDFLLSPQDYVMRMLGEPCIDMKPFASIAAHGILPIIENDTRTHFGRMLGVYPKSECQTFTAEQSRGIIRRDMGMALCRNQPLCLYDLMLGTGFDFPECVEDGRVFAAVNRWCVERNVRRCAEIAVVMGESSIMASPRMTALVPGGVEVPMYQADGTATKTIRKRCLYTGEIGSLGLSRLARIGAPVDYLLAEDLAANPGDYKLYVFLNCTRYDDRLLAAVRGLQAKNCTILWTYAPGYVKGIDASVVNMRELSGFEFVEKKGLCEPVAVFNDGRRMGTPEAKAAPLFEVCNADETLARYPDGSVAIATKRVGHSLSVWSGVWLYDTAFLRQMAERSGVHSFVSTDDPVEANGSFIMLHVRREGRKTVHLPRKTSVVDVFAQRIVARDAESFDFDAPLHSSHLFYYGDEPEAFLPRRCVKVLESGSNLSCHIGSDTIRQAASGCSRKRDEGVQLRGRLQ